MTLRSTSANLLCLGRKNKRICFILLSTFCNFAVRIRISMEENKIVIYQTEDGQTQIDVRLENETVWLTQSQMAELFQTDRTSILRHIGNIYRTDELEEEATCAKFAQVREEGTRIVTRHIPYYNLDMIISVGYRVNSKRGIKFRQWANRILKQFLIKGFAINDRIRQEQIGELRQLVQVVGRAITNQQVPDTIESQDLLNVVVDYSYALDTLDNYDYERLTIDNTLVALTLMIAESRTEEKDVMVKVVVNLINHKN